MGGCIRTRADTNAAHPPLRPTKNMRSSALFSDGDSPMAKGQMKSNKEKRKPKQDKGDKKAAKK